MKSIDNPVKTCKMFSIIAHCEQLQNHFSEEKNMKKLTTLAAAALALAMTGAGALAQTTIQLGTTVNEQDSFQVAAEKFAELVEERTNGESVRSTATARWAAKAVSSTP